MKAAKDMLFLYRYKHCGIIECISFFISELMRKFHQRLSVFMFGLKYLKNVNGGAML